MPGPDKFVREADNSDNDKSARIGLCWLFRIRYSRKYSSSLSTLNFDSSRPPSFSCPCVGSSALSLLSERQMLGRLCGRNFAHRAFTDSEEEEEAVAVSREGKGCRVNQCA